MTSSVSVEVCGLTWSELISSLNLFQIGHGARGDVTILPTLVVNNRQYRGLNLIFEFFCGCKLVITQFM